MFGCISMQRKLDTRWGTSYSDVCNATEICLRHHAQVVVPAHRSYKRAFGRDPYGFVYTCGEFMESASADCHQRSLVEGRHTRCYALRCRYGMHVIVRMNRYTVTKHDLGGRRVKVRISAGRDNIVSWLPGKGSKAVQEEI